MQASVFTALGASPAQPAVSAPAYVQSSDGAPGARVSSVNTPIATVSLTLAALAVIVGLDLMGWKFSIGVSS